MSNVLITSDIHLNDNVRDADRWNLFPWMIGEIERRHVSTVIIGGDVTDVKNRHDAKLVKRVVENLKEVSHRAQVIINCGNHDYVDPHFPFFGFLEAIPHIHFVVEASHIPIKGYDKPFLFLPHTRNVKDWEPATEAINLATTIVCHQTFTGAVVENGQKMEGFPVSLFAKSKAKVYSGDVHVPQTLNKGLLEYVGAPFWCHFSDSFTPRVILLDNKGQHDLHFPFRPRYRATPSSVSELDRQKYAAGSQLKIRFQLKRTDYADWSTIKQQVTELCKKREWELHGLEPVLVADTVLEKKVVSTSVSKSAGSVAQILEEYGKRMKVTPEILAGGKQLLEVK